MSASPNGRSQDPGRRSQLKRLLIRPGAIGDVIVSLPALEHLRADYTEVWTPGRTVPLIRFADRVRSIASTGIELVGITESPAIHELAGFDEIVSWYGSNRPEFRDAVSHLPCTFHDAVPPFSDLHAVDYYLAQVGAPLGAVPRIDCPRTDGPYIAIHPFSGSPRKNWPLDRFMELAAGLNDDVRFCVGPDQEMRGAVYIPDLYDLGKWLASARLYIGNDSGITHLAATVGTPIIALFGPTDPSVWAPRGPQVCVLRNPDLPDVMRTVLKQSRVRHRW